MTRWDTSVRYAQLKLKYKLIIFNAVSLHVTMFSRRKIGFYTHIYENFNFKLCVVMVLAPTRHPRNGFSCELENYQGGSYPQLLAKFNANTPRKIPLGIVLRAVSPPDSFRARVKNRCVDVA